MSKAIDELREHFNQRPVPNSKVIIEERNKVNAMIDAVESENAKLRELVYDMLQDEERGHNDELTFDEHVERADELGVRLYG